MRNWSYSLLVKGALDVLTSDSCPQFLCTIKYLFTSVWLYGHKYISSIKYEYMKFVYYSSLKKPIFRDRGASGTISLYSLHYIGVTWTSSGFNLPAGRLFVQHFIQAHSKRKLCATAPLWGKCRDDTWISYAHYCPFMSGNHRWSVVPLAKRQ